MTKSKLKTCNGCQELKKEIKSIREMWKVDIQQLNESRYQFEKLEREYRYHHCFWDKPQ